MGGSSLSFEESHVLAVDEFGPASVVDGDRAVEDMIISEGSDELWKPTSPKQVIKFSCVICCSDLTYSEI